MLARGLATGMTPAALAPRHQALVAFAVKLTRAPWHVGAADRDLLVEAGFSTREQAHAALGIAMFNYFNRLADGLGIAADYETGVPIDLDAPAAAPAGGVPPPRTGSPPPGDWLDSLTVNPPARELIQEWRQFQLRPTPELDAGARARICRQVSTWSRAERCRRTYEALERSTPPSALPEATLSSLLAHAERLTIEPWSCTESDLARLRARAVDDLGILRLTMLVAFLSFEHRAVAGLFLA